MSDTWTLYVLWKPKATDRNPEQVYVAPSPGGHGHGGLDRTLRHRGVEFPPLAKRRMNPEEVESTPFYYRVGYWKYSSWEQLIEDEKAILQHFGGDPDSEWIRDLIELSKQYSPDFPGEVKTPSIQEQEQQLEQLKLFQ